MAELGVESGIQSCTSSLLGPFWTLRILRPKDPRIGGATEAGSGEVRPGLGDWNQSAGHAELSVFQCPLVSHNVVITFQG